jgi:hypothetical protein
MVNTPGTILARQCAGQDFSARLETRLKKINGEQAKLIEPPKIADLDL